MAADGSIIIDTKMLTDGFQKGVADIRKSLNGFAGSIKKIGLAIGAAFAVDTVSQFGKESLEAASNIEAAASQFSQVFGELENAASQSLSKIADETGIIEERMKGSYTQIAAFAKTTGMDTAGALKLANRAMVAVADSAAFYDRSLEETTESLQSFLKGNYENDAALGLSATETTRNAAANKLYGKSFIELSESQKQLTLLQMVEDANAASGALGQAARESDTWTNQTGNLNQAFVNLKATFGKMILPLAIEIVKRITNIINAINVLLAKLTTLSNAFKSFSEMLTGNNASNSSGGMANVAADAANAAESTTALADATENAADATREAKKANDKYLSGLDEIKRYQAPDSGSASDRGAGIGTTPSTSVDYGSLSEGESSLSNVNSLIDGIIDKFKQLKNLFVAGFWDGLGNYKPILEELKGDLSSVGRNLREIFTDPNVLNAANRFADTFAQSLGKISGSVAGIGLSIATNLVGGIEKFLSENKDRIKNYLVSMFDIGSDISSTVGDLSVAISDIFSVFSGDTAQQITGNIIGIFAEIGMLASELAGKLGRDIIEGIATPIIENKDKIKEAIAGTLEAIEPFTSGLLEAVQKIRDVVNEVYDEHLKPLFDSIKEGLSDILGKLLDGYNNYIVPVLQGLGQKFQELISGPFGETMGKIQDFLGKFIDAIKMLWENVLVPFLAWIAESIMPILAPIIEMLGGAVLDFLKTAIDAIGNIADVLSGIVDFIVGVFTGDWEKAWTGIKEIFGGVWNLIKGIISDVIGLISNIISSGMKAIGAAIKAIWNGIKSFLSSLWNSLKDTASDLWNGIKKVIVGVATSLSEKVKDAISGLKSVFGEVFNGIKNVIKSPINGIIKLVNGLIAGVEWMVNSIADALNSLQIQIPYYGGYTFGFNIPTQNFGRIPYLATGAVIPPNAPFMAVLGDQKRGTNVEAPLSTIEEAVENVFRRHGGMNSNSGAVYHISAQLSRRVLFDEFITEAKLRKQQSGKNPLMEV